MVGLVWAQSTNRVIGRDGALPWRLPEDLAHFRALTDGATVVMGRLTWESLPAAFRPLPGRRNLVLTHRSDYAAPGADVVASLDEALACAETDDIWVIGGAAVYAEAMAVADRLAVTDVDVEIDGDVRAPEVGPGWAEVDRDPHEGWHASTTGLRFRWRELRPATG